MHDRIKRLLEAELDSHEFASFYDYLKFNNPALKEFPRHSNLIAFLHDQTNHDYPAKNRLFKILISEYQQNLNRLLVAFFIIVFHPGIRRIHFDNIKYYPYGVEEFSRKLRGTLLDVIAAYDCEAKPSKIYVTILGRVRNSLYDIKKNFSSNPVAIDINNIPAKNPSADYDPEFLTLLVKRRVVSIEEVTLIFESRIKEVSLKNLARQEGVSYEALRKRRQRSEAKIRRYISRQKKIFARKENIAEKTIDLEDFIAWMGLE